MLVRPGMAGAACLYADISPSSLFPDWASAIRVAALDCAEEKNHEVCRAYDVHFYPTFRVSPPHFQVSPNLPVSPPSR